MILALAAAALAPPAFAPVAMAALGGTGATVQGDQMRLHASLRRVALASHVRSELTLPNGAWVHEFTNAQGQVFAIRWSGPGKPDLRSLLGDHFSALQGAGRRLRHGVGSVSRRPLSVDQSDMKMTGGGHMGYFWGIAWLPALLPAGVAPGDLQ